MSLNQIIHKKLQNKLKAENSTPNISNNTCTLNPVNNIAITTNTSHNNTLNSPLTNKWLGTDNLINKDCSMDSIKNLSIQLMNTYENSMNEIKENKNNIIHNLSKTLHQVNTNIHCLVVFFI
ncbi:unnamed protein product [Trichobilharzia regenti]|nr:unnamed protein product [Trichobilharzia regenti]